MSLADAFAVATAQNLKTKLMVGSDKELIQNKKHLKNNNFKKQTLPTQPAT
jgi:hypothetical protein